MRTVSKRREQIVEAATAAITKQGFDGTTVGQIAETLGVSKAAVSYYFPAKRDLVPAVLGPLIETLEALPAQQGRTTDRIWPDDARRLLEKYFDALVQNLTLARWIDTDQAARIEVDAQLQQVQERLIEVIAGGSRKRADRMRAMAVIGGVMRPIREVELGELIKHRDEIVDAALVSFAPLERDR